MVVAVNGAVVVVVVECVAVGIAAVLTCAVVAGGNMDEDEEVTSGDAGAEGEFVAVLAPDRV